ncbi:MAG: GIY-YIG nuclease family protein [Sulfitobacter sp.]
MRTKTLTRHDAQKEYGPRFVEIMMKDEKSIVMTDKQLNLAKRWKLLYEGHFSPFSYDYVYVISNDKGSTKVGTTSLPRSRFNQLQSGSPDDLYLDHAIVLRKGAGRNLEKTAHRKLAAAGLHKRGEWFSGKDIPDIVEEIADTQYRDVTIDLEVAWNGAEQMMPLARKILGKTTRDGIDAEQRRSEFLWLATILRG